MGEDRTAAVFAAQHVLGDGSEPLDVLIGFLERLDPRLVETSRQRAEAGDGDAEGTLNDARLVLIFLREALREDGSTDMRLHLKRRRRGQPIDKRERAQKFGRAAAIVERALQAGDKQESGIAAAMAETGLSRSEIFNDLRRQRKFKRLFGPDSLFGPGN